MVNVIGGGTNFKVGGGAKFLKSKMVIKTGALAPAVALARRRARGVSEGGCGPLRSWSFFENVVLNEAIWCTIFHHVKHLAALSSGVFFTLEQDSQKSGGAMPPQSEKWRGHWPPGPPVPPPMVNVQ